MPQDWVEEVASAGVDAMAAEKNTAADDGGGGAAEPVSSYLAPLTSP